MCESEGATSIEYGLVASLVAVAVMGAVFFLGDSLMWSYYLLAFAVYDEKPPPEVMAAMWPHVNGGDEIDLPEYIDLRSKFGVPKSDEEIAYDFGWADQDDNDYLDYDEWIEHKDAPDED